MKAQPAQLPEELMDEVARRFRALGEPVRLRILSRLESGERSVNDLAEALEAGQSNISRHLQALLDCGLVARRREGTTVYYRVGDPMIFTLCDLVCRNARQQAQEKLTRLVAAKPGRRMPVSRTSAS
jgi:DNA-binding transcriptional ArsR family regulator